MVAQADCTRVGWQADRLPRRGTFRFSADQRVRALACPPAGHLLCLTCGTGSSQARRVLIASTCTDSAGIYPFDRPRSSPPPLP